MLSLLRLMLNEKSACLIVALCARPVCEKSTNSVFLREVYIHFDKEKGFD